MAQTITTSSPRVHAQVATGRYLDTGTVAAYTFVLGFKPRYIRLVNLASTGARLEYFEGMAAASAYKEAAAGDGAIITSNGITVSDTGFIFGLDTDANVSSEQVSFVAIA
jgi:hypothetical protein